MSIMLGGDAGDSCSVRAVQRLVVARERGVVLGF